jgi:hypothetical protein
MHRIAATKGNQHETNRHRYRIEADGMKPCAPIDSPREIGLLLGFHIFFARAGVFF